MRTTKMHTAEKIQSKFHIYTQNNNYHDHVLYQNEGVVKWFVDELSVVSEVFIGHRAQH